ncbi:MAG: 3-oxoacyl-ACP reductase FabG [Clostridiales bacterium]|nr:3-oxoacyl-ACP reductase FabG [Clostridiales bacterium]
MKTLLIIGGSRGIGKAVAEQAAGKYNVAFTYYKSEEKAKVLEAELNKKGAAKAIYCDISDSDSVESAFKQCIERFGKINALVVSSGISRQTLFSEITNSEWNEMLGVNLSGVFYANRAAAKEMLKRKSGAIVNISSVWGVVGASMEVHYSAAKAGVIGLTKALAKELAPSGIRVNAVAPGAIDTDMLSVFTEDEKKAIADDVPLQRLGTADEVAKAVLFLLEADYITGAALDVGGGYGL